MPHNSHSISRYIFGSDSCFIYKFLYSSISLSSSPRAKLNFGIVQEVFSSTLVTGILISVAWGVFGVTEVNHLLVVTGQSVGRRMECLRETEKISGVKMFREGHGRMTQTKIT